MRRLALVPLIIGVLLFPPVASALGLGEIEMQSALNQRLDAEIPLRGVDEDQSDAIIVTLASEEAFRQVGLQRPFSLTRLQFALRRHDDGSHYVHVTSAEPVVEPFLSFLIEIDWPDGNLLREYTVLLDPPVFVSEPREAEAPAATSAAGDESMPAAGVPAAIERDEEPASEPAAETAAAEPEPEPEPEAEPATEPVAEVEPPEGDFADTPVFLQAEQEDERAEAEARETAAAEPAPEAEVTTATTRGYDVPEEYGPVERGEALWNIATRLKRADMSVQQMMLALLRYNRDAFINDNINLLRQGYVLRIPEADEVLSLSAQQAVAQVREHNALWQEFRTAARAGGARQAVEAPAVEPPAATGDEAAAGDDAGLKIVGAADGSGASSDESASATGNGDQPASEELKLAREQLESAQMEKEELQSRVSDLEETVDKMERLIEVREDQLARLQDQLRKLQQEEEAAAAETAADAPAEDDGAAGTATGADEAAPAEEQAAASGDPETAEEGDDTEGAAAAAGDGGGSGSDTGGGDAGTEAAAGGDGTTEATDGSDAAATQVADAGDTATAAAEASGAGATSGESGVVTTRTQPAERGWMARAMATWDSVKGTVGGAVAGLTAGAGLGSLMQNPLTLPLAGAAVVLLLGGLLLARRRRAAGDEETLEVDTAAAPPDADAGDPFAAMMQTESTDDVAVDEDTAAAWDQDDSRTVAAGEAEEAESALMSEDFNLDDLDEEDRAGAGADASEDDTIAEADVYLAYGLHQQAEDLLKLALQEHPDRLDYHAKMLEALYGAGKSEEFVTRAQEFRERVDDPGDELWLRAVAMGQDLAPDNALFQQEVDENLKPAGTTAVAAPETDLDVGGDEGGATDLDFSFEEDSGDRAEEDDDEFARTVMVDSDQLESLGGGAKAAGREEPTAAGDGDDMDFDLGELELGDDDSGPAAASPTGSAETGGDEEGGLEFDLGDLDVGDAGDEDQPATTPASDETGTAGGDFADVDLGSLDVGNEDSPGGGEDDDSYDIDLGDLDSGGLETETASADDDSFDLGDFEIDSGAEPETASDEADEQSVSFEDDDDKSPADLEGDFDAGGSAGGDEDELDTMLDLARAYIDMGDSESARAALEEVAEAGNDQQRGEAQSLLESV